MRSFVTAALAVAFAFAVAGGVGACSGDGFSSSDAGTTGDDGGGSDGGPSEGGDGGGGAVEAGGADGGGDRRLTCLRTACDLGDDVCCADDVDAGGRCVPLSSGGCPSAALQLTCDDGADCADGEVCCITAVDLSQRELRSRCSVAANCADGPTTGWGCDPLRGTAQCPPNWRCEVPSVFEFPIFVCTGS